MKKRYAISRGVNHPSVGMTYCPYCGAVRGVPCRANGQKHSGPYAKRTHMDRIRLANKKFTPDR